MPEQRPPDPAPETPLDYASAGVNIDVGDAFVARLRGLMESTHGPQVIPAPNGFAGLFGLGPDAGDAVLVACTDGVGTKLRVAFAAKKHDTVGIDLVAMSVNDCIVTGARPLFFLDYIGTAALDPNVAMEIIAGIVEGCKQGECALLGGETAEMPDMYPAGEYDLAGFCVGLAGRHELIDTNRVRAGDVVIGLPSAGLHSNGFSLARRALLDRGQIALDAHVPELGRTLAAELLEPTKIYVRTVRELLANHRANVHAMAHITGGGLVGNVPRVLPATVAIDIDKSAWQRPAIFDLIQRTANVDEREMWRVFNMGIGFVFIVAEFVADAVLGALRQSGESPVMLGRVREAATEGESRAVAIR